MATDILPIVSNSFSLAGLDIITLGKNRNQQDIVVNDVVTPPAIYDGAIAENLLPATQIGWRYDLAIRFDLDATRNSFGRQIASFTTGAVTALAGGTAIFNTTVNFSDTLTPATFVVIQLLDTSPFHNDEIKLDTENDNVEYPDGADKIKVTLDHFVFANHIVVSTKKAKIDPKSNWIVKENGEYVDENGDPLQTIEFEIEPNNNERADFEDLNALAGIRNDEGSTTNQKNDSKTILIDPSYLNDTIYVTYIGVTNHIMREVARLQWRLIMIGYSVRGKTYFTSPPIVFGQRIQVSHFRFEEWEEAKEDGSGEKQQMYGWRRAAQFGQEAPPPVTQDQLNTITDDEIKSLINNAITYNWGVFDISPESLLINDRDKLSSTSATEKVNYPFVNGGFSRVISDQDEELYDENFVSGEITPNSRLFPIITPQNFVVDQESSGQLLTESGVSGGLLVARYTSLLYQAKINPGARAWIEYESPGVAVLATQTDWSMLSVQTSLEGISMSAFYDELTHTSYVFSGPVTFSKSSQTYTSDSVNYYRFLEEEITTETAEDPVAASTENAKITGLYGQDIKHIKGVPAVITENDQNVSFTIVGEKISDNKKAYTISNTSVDINDTYIRKIIISPTGKTNLSENVVISLTNSLESFRNNNETDVQKLSEISNSIFFNIKTGGTVRPNEQAQYIVVTNTQAEGGVPEVVLENSVFLNSNSIVIEGESNDFKWNALETDSEGKLIPLEEPEVLTKEETGEKFTSLYKTEEVQLFSSIPDVRPFSSAFQISVKRDENGYFWMAYTNSDKQINLTYTTNKNNNWNVLRNVAVPLRVSQSGSYGFDYPRIIVSGTILYLFYSHNNTLLYKPININEIDTLLHNDSLLKELEKKVRNINAREVSEGLQSLETMKYLGEHYSVSNDSYGVFYAGYETDEGVRIAFSNDKSTWNLAWRKPDSVSNDQNIRIHNIDTSKTEKTPFLLTKNKEVSIYYIVSGSLFRKRVGVDLVRLNSDDDDYAKIKSEMDSIPVEFMAGPYSEVIQDAIASDDENNEVKQLLETGKLKVHGGAKIANAASDSELKVTTVVEGSIAAYSDKTGHNRIFFRDQNNRIRSIMDYGSSIKLDDIPSRGFA